MYEYLEHLKEMHLEYHSENGQRVNTIIIYIEKDGNAAHLWTINIRAPQDIRSDVYA